MKFGKKASVNIGSENWLKTILIASSADTLKIAMAVAG